MDRRINKYGLDIAGPINDIVEEIMLGTGISSDQFWQKFEKITSELAPVNTALLEKRELFESQINDWYIKHRGHTLKTSEYIEFLNNIGYLVPKNGDFKITTNNVDPEIATIAGPQLVVPINNSRFALNAANARWGSLFDALYSTDAMGIGLPTKFGFDNTRGQTVILYGQKFLDQAIPLQAASHRGVKEYRVTTHSNSNIEFQVILNDGFTTSLSQPEKLVGYRRDQDTLILLFQNNALHIELHINAEDHIGKLSTAGLKDIILESATSTIMDCEDSVSAVDAQDKAEVYKNWLGLMKGGLTTSFSKNGKSSTRKLAEKRSYTDLQGKELKLTGRSLMLIRNVGSSMYTDAIKTSDGNSIPETIMDAMVTVACAIHDLSKFKADRNSRYGSIYIVKPKMHGPEEVAFANTLFTRIEEALGLPPLTIKIGVMDEERRTSANLKECIREVKDRIFFINTGFLDRTGDEIHTCMEAGPVVAKHQIKNTQWLKAYEEGNVITGIECGLPGKGQIGKGMWAQPDDMKQMLNEKILHPKNGANCSWVPSPTAATLHAIHYHQVDVQAAQNKLKGRAQPPISTLLTPPLMDETYDLSPRLIQLELDDNCQSILGYVVKWVNQGIGCSKVPNIDDTQLMEDRATLRISSQLLSNWLLHGICTDDQFLETMKRMAIIVDAQNRAAPNYTKMSDDFDNNVAFLTACQLVYQGTEQPNGYTEPPLHFGRLKFKKHAD